MEHGKNFPMLRSTGHEGMACRSDISTGSSSALQFHATMSHFLQSGYEAGCRGSRGMGLEQSLAVGLRLCDMAAAKCTVTEPTRTAREPR
jgi:hypothetical protein